MEVRNRFKELDLIDRVPDELWTEVRDIVQETGIKTIPMEKKWKKAKWLSEEALQISVKRREAKSKGEKERFSSVQFSSVAQSCPTLVKPINRSMPGLPVHRQLPEFTQNHVH